MDYLNHNFLPLWVEWHTITEKTSANLHNSDIGHNEKFYPWGTVGCRPYIPPIK